MGLIVALILMVPLAWVPSGWIAYRRAMLRQTPRWIFAITCLPVAAIAIFAGLALQQRFFPEVFATLDSAEQVDESFEGLNILLGVFGLSIETAPFVAVALTAPAGLIGVFGWYYALRWFDRRTISPAELAALEARKRAQADEKKRREASAVALRARIAAKREDGTCSECRVPLTLSNRVFGTGLCKHCHRKAVSLF